MKQNLYAFGDSFCKYAWPMWPEIIGQCYKKVHNYGLPGCGNFYIFYKVIMELSSLELTETDTVIVQWSEPLRYDFIENDDYWSGLGIGSAELFVKHKADYLNNENTAVIKHLTYMLSIAEFLSTKKCQWLFIFLSDDSMSHLSKLRVENHLKEDYKKLIKKLSTYKANIVDTTSISNSLKKNKSTISLSMCDGNVFQDDHPTPLYTFYYIEKFLNKHLNLDLKKIKKYADKNEELLHKSKVKHNNKLVNDFDLLHKVFYKND